jgi:beta-lactamase class A
MSDMKRLSILIAIVLAFAAPWSGPSASADQIAPNAAIERLFTSDKIDADWFGASFLQQVTVAQIQAIVDQFKSQLGAYQSVHPDGDHFSTELEKASIPTYISLDGNGRIIGLLFKAPVMRSKDLQAALAPFKQLPGQVSLTIVSAGKPATDYNADKALAVGSAFKLAVLSAIKKQVDARRMSWSQLVTLREDWKSLSSGILQTWPAGSPLTLFTVSALMISQSDNTAADIALHTVGRAAVQAESPRNSPFLTTREAFQLKDPANATLLAKWRDGDALARRGVLTSLAALPLPSASIFSGGVIAQDVEWFFTVKELCSLMAGVASLQLTSINPGITDPALWTHVSYKGGSEPGVLNLTAQVTNKAGTTYCVSATWNDTKPLDETKFELMYGTLLNTLQ